MTMLIDSASGPSMALLPLAAAVRDELDGIAGRAASVEKARMVSAKNIEVLRAAGFMRALVPVHRGGDERDLLDFCTGVRTVSSACPSTGWVSGVLNVHPVGVQHFRPEIQDEVWATGPDTVICSSGSPSIKATIVDGGIRVSGKARWSSGSDFAEWALVGVKVPDLGDSEYPQRNYRPYMFLAHRSQYEIDDTWYSTGMRGSGSKDLLFDGQFVPWERLERLDALNFNYAHGAGSSEYWAAWLPFPVLFSVFLPAVALGCADGMIREFTTRQRVRKNAYTGAQGILNPAGYMRLAESTHELEALTIYYRGLVESLQEQGEQRERVTEQRFMATQSSLAFVTERAVQVIDRVFEGAGSSAIADASPMQRFWRDAHAVRMHQGSDYDQHMQHFGRTLLGLPPTPDL